jgi:phospholipid/cholesterol/gamma-HCH transport system permease protein
MEVSGANPVKYLVVTRILACTLMIPLLTLFADAFSIAGGFIGINTSAKMSLDLYLTKSFETLYFSDLFPAMVKSTFFGFAIGFVGCYKGYTSNKGTESVGLAANSAVVAASIWIIIIDAVAVQVTSVFIYN